VANRDTIVIGASAGGVEALPKLISGLPADLGAAVFVTMHMSARDSGFLADRFNFVGNLPATRAVDGELIQKNHIYCAAADRHLMLQGNRVRLSSGPRESHARPSIDVLFRSAAFERQERVIGVVLTGMLDDGTAGLWTIKDRGGLTIVQSPEEAPHPSMPESALRHVQVDHVLKIAEIPAVLASLVKAPITERKIGMPDEKLRIENQIALDNNALELGVRKLGAASFYTCPECHGSMVAVKDGSFTRYRCHTGHGFTPSALSTHSRQNVEKTLWSALAQLEEREVLLEEMQRTVRDLSGAGQTTDAYGAERHEVQRFAKRLRQLLTDPALHEEANGDEAKSHGSEPPDAAASLDRARDM
jgi:two-component system, chemotaxis family, protein-glutamate methylesterase/glutaminase